MSQFNLSTTNSTGGAIKVVSAGDPVTLVLNHSTKNTVYIGATSSVGSGNLLDATPLDPYASIVVNGEADVWAIAAVQTEEATVYTFQNSIAWTPKAIQPNIIDPNSPYSAAIGTDDIILDVPAGAQGLFIQWPSADAAGFSDLTVTGEQSGVVYYNKVPSVLQVDEAWVPVLSDLDTTVQLQVTVANITKLTLCWLMSNFTAGLVDTGQVGDVNISGVTADSGSLPVTVGNDVTAIFSHIDDRELAANQKPMAFDVTLTVGSTSVLLPATVGLGYYIHDFRVEGVDAAAMYCQLQDTSGNALANIYNGDATIPLPPLGPNSFSGAPVGLGLGVQLENHGTATQRFVGYITYSE
jgi:hypothetical protein